MSADARQEARAVQRQLLGVGPTVRVALAVAVGAGVVAAGLLVVQAWVVAAVMTDAIAGQAPAATAIGVLAIAISGRALLGAVTELAGRWGARVAMEALREQIATAALRGRSAPISGARRGEIVTAATQGVDALSDLYARAVPAVALAGAVPVALVAAVGWRDPLVGGLLAITLPVVVIFMVLVGQRSAAHARDRQHALATLGAHFLEVVRGLPTLRAHGRQHAQLPTLRAISERYRDESLGALRIAFLSALVLEMLAMLGTAIAAAVIGVQLAQGRMTLEVGLFILLLAPEIYAPLREAGQRFHAAEDGTEAARHVLAYLDEPGPLRDRPGAVEPTDARGGVADQGRGGDPSDRGERRGARAGGRGVETFTPQDSAVVLHGAAVHGDEGRLDALAPIDLVVAPGRSLAIVGPSGAGKSTLLELVARLRDPDAGSVHCGDADLRSAAPETWWRHLAWLAQRPELQAGTLREVLEAAASAADPQGLASGAGQDLNAGREQGARSRLEQALLRADAQVVLDELPDGLKTGISPGGRGLSAGQTQRLCLAGVLASRAPLLVLDEPTAHLDAVSAAKVRDGIMDAARGRTLVVATHDLELAARCDDVVELAAVDSLGHRDRRSEPELEGAPQAARSDAQAPGAGEARRDGEARSVDGRGAGRPKALDGEESPPTSPGLEGGSRRPRLRRGRAFLFGALGAVAGVALLAVSGWLIVKASERPPVLALLSTIVLVRTLGFVRALSRYWERLSGHDAVLGELAEERVAWYRRLADRIGAPGVPASADLLTRFTTDVDALQDRALRVSQPAVVAAVTVVASTLVAALILPAAALVLLAAAFVGGLLGPAVAWAAGRRAARRQAPVRAAFAEQLDEIVRLGPGLALVGLAADRRRAQRAGAVQLGRADRGLAWAAAVGGGISALGAGAALMGVLVVAGRATAEGRLAPVAFGAVVLLAVGLLEVLRPLPEAALRLVAVQRAQERLAEVADGAPALAPASGPIRALPRGAALRADRLSYRPGGPEGALVLRDASLVVEPGERVAIVGPSGAGKSTLLALLGRLADPDGGTVALGATDLRAASVAQVRTRVRVAGQDAQLLAGTLAANLRIGREDATDADLGRVLRDVGLGPWLAALPDGLSTLVGEDGSAVSGGQRQRLGVARALLSPAEIVLLDEPTAMLDPTTAGALLNDAVHAAGDRTVVVVTHDGDRLDAFDRVLDLRGGRLYERAAVGVPA